MSEVSDDELREALRADLAAVLDRYRELFGDSALAILRADLNDVVLREPPKKTREGVRPAATAAPPERPASPPRGRFPEILGNSPAMREMFDLIERVAPTNTTVLIQGESGTGKELVARAIHRLSQRRKGPFVAENCAALPETLLESELFGHSKGAFTGADRSRKGRFSAADKGTLFLDEVGDMSPALQKKLLRALQEGEIRPVGSNTSIKVDVRFLSASNKDLHVMMGEGRFREDLFYRLSPIRIFLPPLRDREDDVVLIAEELSAKVAAECGRSEPPDLSPAVLEAFRRYRWPGNVRELQNEVQRVVALSDPTRPVGLSDLSPELQKAGAG